MSIGVLHPEESNRVKRRSSIDQFRNTISVMQKGGWTPIVFDMIDFINCETVKHHPIIITFNKNHLGYNFDIASCEITQDNYILFDELAEKLMPLPSWFGGGFYKELVNKQAYVNFDGDNSLGTRNHIKLKVGLDYYSVGETLPPA